MPTLEAQLTALTQEFVARLVDALRNASFAEVAALSAHGARHDDARARAPRDPASALPATRGGRQTAAVRAEIG